MKNTGKSNIKPFFERYTKNKNRNILNVKAKPHGKITESKSLFD